MGCTPSGFKSFLVCCNVALLCVGVSVLILGLKMQLALTVLLLMNIPTVMKAVKAVIATGFFISFAGITGICGACYECLWLLLVHIITLGIIVIMEFTLGVTLMIVKKSIENFVVSENCNSLCAAALNAMVLDYALPSAGLMMTIIVVEALMIYSSIRLYFYIRDKPKTVVPSGPSVVVQNVQMQNVAALPAYLPTAQPMYAPQLEYMSHQVQRHDTTPVQSQQLIAPPDYTSLSPQQQDQHLPPYIDAVPSIKTANENSVPTEFSQETNANLNPV